MVKRKKYHVIMEEIQHKKKEMFQKESNDFFYQVSEREFKTHIKKFYWGLPPFSKDDSYNDYIMEYEVLDGFEDLNYSNQFVLRWSRSIGIKPSKRDRVRALTLFKYVKEKAEAVKCECCKGKGYKN